MNKTIRQINNGSFYGNIRYIYPQIYIVEEIEGIEEIDIEYLKDCEKYLEKAYEIFMKYAYGDQENECNYRLNVTKFANLLFLESNYIDLPDSVFLEEIKPGDEDYEPW